MVNPEQSWPVVPEGAEYRLAWERIAVDGCPGCGATEWSFLEIGVWGGAMGVPLRFEEIPVDRVAFCVRCGRNLLTEPGHWILGNE